ncbi:hypothetical protein [Kyrpidia spormannii]|uniref:Uncharacterized protein n=1 Tax=Kyrpidia spormannii TaxID=2055160 RepID=A0A6F9EEI5_9BACL|nr:hypothetical protein [Kyrpidia spormannii]CAB3395289.1 conserved protein of unknown function [Kyrpidia spormannii]
MVDRRDLINLVIEALQRRGFPGDSADGSLQIVWLPGQAPSPEEQELSAEIKSVLQKSGEAVIVDGRDPDAESLLKQAECLVVGPCDQSILVGGALGLTTDRAGALLAKALLASMPVSMVLNPQLSVIFRPEASVRPYLKLLRDYAEALQHYGVDVVCWEEFVTGWRPPANPFERMNASDLSADSRSVESVQCRVRRATYWTVKDLARRRLQPGDVLVLPQGVRLTPGAREWLRDQSVALKIMEGGERADR